MSKDNKSGKIERGANSLDKLAQLDTSQKKLDNRARKKAYSKAIAMPMMTHANTHNSPLKYHRTLSCGAVLLQDGNKLTSNYCKQRWCSVCGSIRTAKLINQYQKPIKAMKNPLFITITTQSVYADELEPRFNEMKQAFVRVKRNMQKTYGIKLIAIRKTESQYKYVGNDECTFNPHFHIVADLLPCQALLFKTMWLNQWSMEIANLDAQDIRKADQESLMELFKYEVKPVTTNKDGKFIPAALDVIYQSLYRQKAIQAYGMKAEKPSPEQDEVAETLQATDEKTEIWIFDKLNYYNASGDALTNFEPEDKDQEFFKLTQYNYASETTIRSSETRNIDFQDHQREKAANTSLLQTE